MELTDSHMPNDPWDLPNWQRDWAEGRPDRPGALAHVVCAPRDPGAAIAFLVQLLDGVAGEPYEVEWPQRAVATPVTTADIVMLVLAPKDRTGGPLIEFAMGPNAGVYALAWRMAAPAAAEAWFAKKGLPLQPTEAGSSYTHELMLDGARHWFAADRQSKT